jgi:hypothetical protein
MISLGLPARVAVVAAPMQAAAVHPRLGDPFSVWVKYFGKATPYEGVLVGWQRCKGSPPTFRLDVGVEANQVTMVDGAVCTPDPNRPISRATQLAEAARYFPLGSTKIGTVQAVGLPVVEYFSAPLPKTYAGKKLSLDCEMAHAKPGLFTVDQHPYANPYDGTWNLMVGTCVI